MSKSEILWVALGLFDPVQENLIETLSNVLSAKSNLFFNLNSLTASKRFQKIKK